MTFAEFFQTAAGVSGIAIIMILSSMLKTHLRRNYM